MKKIVLAILMVMFFATTALSSSFIYKVIEKSAVSIFSLGYYLVNCSGVVIGENETKTFVLTCKHCLDISEEMYVEESKADIIVTTSDEDLALLIVDGKIKDKEIAPIANSLGIGDKLYTVGYPNLIFEPRKAKGEVIRFTDDWAWATVEVIDGCSGSGFFNAKVELVGIVWGGLDKLSAFEPLKDIKKFLEKINYETLIQD